MSKKECIYILITIIFLAFFLSRLASDWPDILERLIGAKAPGGAGRSTLIMASPMPDYVWPGLKNEDPRAEARGFSERNTERPRSIRSLNAAVLWPRMYKKLAVSLSGAFGALAVFIVSYATGRLLKKRSS